MQRQRKTYVKGKREKTRLGVHGEGRRCQNNHIPNEGARVGSSKNRSKSVVGRGSFPQGRTAEKERRGHKSVFPSSSVWGERRSGVFSDGSPLKSEGPPPMPPQFGESEEPLLKAQYCRSRGRPWRQRGGRLRERRGGERV